MFYLGEVFFWFGYGYGFYEFFGCVVFGEFCLGVLVVWFLLCLMCWVRVGLFWFLILGGLFLFLDFLVELGGYIFFLLSFLVFLVFELGDS